MQNISLNFFKNYFFSLATLDLKNVLLPKLETKVIFEINLDGNLVIYGSPKDIRLGPYLMKFFRNLVKQKTQINSLTSVK